MKKNLSYIDSVHRDGRIWNLSVMVLLMAFPVAVALMFRVSPDWAALEQNGVSANSEEGEVISTIAIAVSSIVTTLIIIVGVICIVPLTPILQAPVLQPAFEQILPALFGGLGVAFVSKNWKLAVAPVLLMLVLFVFVPALNAGTVGIMVPVAALFTIAVARIMYKKGAL